MKSRTGKYVDLLQRHRNIRGLLLRHSGLPGHHLNIDLAEAFARLAGQCLIYNYSELKSQCAPENTPEEFLAYCGILGLGRLISEGKSELIPKLREAASDERRHIREAAVQALRLIGKRRIDLLDVIVPEWIEGTLFEQSAVIAALSTLPEPDNPGFGDLVISSLDSAMHSIVNSESETTKGYDPLLQTLSHAWSDAFPDQPEILEKSFEKWLPVAGRHGDVRLILKQNLKRIRTSHSRAKWAARTANKLDEMGQDQKKQV